jgi:hypothetical protein
MEPRYKVNELGETVPDIRAEAAIIYNPVTQQVLWEENSQNPRSIRQHHQGDDRGSGARRQSRSHA